jgi:diadenosine tetraphosphate (Ap4A) HIT family hydrolase
MNNGEAAGQTVPHAHVHLIPRRHGDVENPRGGVRGVITRQMSYEIRWHRDRMVGDQRRAC